MYDLKPQARPYAKAAFLAAVEESQIDEMFRDLEVLSEASSNPSINKLIESPEEKSVVVATLKGLFSNQPVKLTENLLDVLGENDRLNLLTAVADIYEDLMLKHNESKVIEVAAPSNLSETTKEILCISVCDFLGVHLIAPRDSSTSIPSGNSVRVYFTGLTLSTINLGGFPLLP